MADGVEAAYLLVQALELLGNADLHRPADLGRVAADVGAVRVEHCGELAGSESNLPDTGRPDRNGLLQVRRGGDTASYRDHPVDADLGGGAGGGRRTAGLGPHTSPPREARAG